MNMKKIMAGVVASTLAVGTMAVAASADTTGYVLFGADWGEPTAEANEVTLSGNWNGAGIGLPEDVLEAANDDFSNITLTFTFTVPTMETDGQAQKDAYGDEESDHVIDDMVVAFIGNGSAYRDGKGTVLVADDGNGGYESSYTHTVKASLINTADEGFYTQVQTGAVTDVVWTITYTVEEAEEPAEDEGGDEPAPAEDEGTDEPAPAEDNNAPAEDNAPAATEAAPAETAAPAAGTGNTATTTPDKNNADTGVEGVAVVAGLAIVAAGAVIVAKKRK